MFLHRKVDDQPNKKLKKTTTFQREVKATTRMLWLLRKLYLRWVVPRKTRSCWILKEADKPGETRCNESRDRFTQSTERQASNREKKGPSFGKIQVKNPHQRSPCAMKFEDWSLEETERQQRCARSKAWNLAKNIYKLKEKDKATFYSPAEEWGPPGCGNKRTGGKRVCGRFWS